jgi:hypothetical protein
LITEASAANACLSPYYLGSAYGFLALHGCVNLFAIADNVHFELHIEPELHVAVMYKRVCHTASRLGAH